VFVAHPLLDRAEVHARLQVRGREAGAVFVQEPVVAAGTIRAGMIAFVANAAVKLRTMGDALAEIEEMIVRFSTTGWEHERTFQILAGTQNFQRLHQAIGNGDLALFPILGDEAPSRLLRDPDDLLL